MSRHRLPVLRSRVAAPFTLGAALWLGVSGCGSERPDGRMSADLGRDLQLAMYARPAAVVSAVEGGPTGAPSGDARGRRDAVPRPRQAPAPRPSPQVEETASPESLLDSPMPAVSITTAEVGAPAAPIEPELPAAGAETPVSVIPVSGPSDASGHEGEREGRRGGGLGGVIGAIIRGGAAGIDNCAAPDARRGRGRGPIITTGGGWGRGMGTVIMTGGAIIAAGGEGGGIRPTFPRR
ncbi:MAG: hypothetical protein IBJ19_10865 [Gemmatimonadaceae bacterium]|nr:hypothetical protein [Gemmatimonadaceae bacterium]